MEYTFNRIFSDNFQTWSRKDFFNIIQGSLNVYPEQVKLRIGFWKLFITPVIRKWSVSNLTWQYAGPFCILTSSMILVLYVPLCCVSDLSLLMFVCFNWSWCTLKLSWALLPFMLFSVLCIYIVNRFCHFSESYTLYSVVILTFLEPQILIAHRNASNV